MAEWGALAPRAQFVLQVPAEQVVLPLDVECVRQVLGNVVSNAVKYGGEGGRVEVMVPEIDGRLGVERVEAA